MIGDENLLLYVNLTGELFYIISHRMSSQGIRYDLQKRVFDDLSLVICNPQMLQELLNGTIQLINYSFTELKLMLSHIVHSSIMNINDYSMEKLFELTLIATKYQYTVCQNPKHILLIALNHVDSMRKTLTDPLSLQSAENLHYTLIESYSTQLLMQMQNTAGGRDDDAESTTATGPEKGLSVPVPVADGVPEKEPDMMNQYQEAILTYLKDVRLKMTNLIKLGLQTANGEFVIESSAQTGKDLVIRPSTLELHGDRGIKLGLSIYDMEIEPGKQSSTIANSKRKSSVTKSHHHHHHLHHHHSNNNSDMVGAAAAGGGGASGSAAAEDEKSAAELENDANQILKAIQGLDLCGTLLGCGNLNEDSTGARGGMLAGLDSKTATAVSSGLQQEPIAPTTITAADFNIVRIDARNTSSNNVNGTSTIMNQIVKELAMDLDLSLTNEEEEELALATDVDGAAAAAVSMMARRRSSSTKLLTTTTTATASAAQLLESAMENSCNEYNN